MRETTDKEAIKRFDEGLRLAISRARELARAQRNNAWLIIAEKLQEIRVNGLRMANGKPLTRQEVLNKTDRRQAILSEKLASGQ